MQSQNTVLVKELIDQIKQIQALICLGKPLSDKDIQFIANQLNIEYGGFEFMEVLARELESKSM